MTLQDEKPLTRSEFEGWATEVKSSLNGIDDRLETIEQKLDRHEVILTEHTTILNEHTQILSDIASTLKTIREELRAHVRLYDRLDNRDHVFADKLGLDLRKVDAEFHPPA